MTIPAVITDRVETFLRNRDDYKSGRYREDEVRREFIDPLFEALGWDVRNTKGYAEAYKDVVTELPTRIELSTRAPDYAFRIGGLPKFLVEAKRPQVRIQVSMTAAYQLRRYGFSMGLNLSILTDFEELAVYDTRIKPDEGDSASKARLCYLTCEEYLENWSWIEQTFSREAILLGSFDKYAAAAPKGRGTSGVDNAFLADVEAWRLAIATDLARNNPMLTLATLNESVQRIIDRIVFLRIAEDRGIEPYGQLRETITRKQGKTTAYQRLFSLFQRADDRYNSGLFHFRSESGRRHGVDDLSGRLSLSDGVLRRIVGNLYYPESPYEFSVMPAEVLGRVYEKFLGHTVALNEDRRVKLEDKPDVRLAGGVYYTPEYVIRYIAQRTLGSWLDSKRAEEVSGKIKGRSLKILDPACGSGSFLLGTYELLLNWYLEQYIEDGPERHAKGRPPRLYRSSKGQWRLTLAERKRILLDHIFGVDKDYQAVETTKLSLLLKVLESEADELVHKQMELIQERVLPDLDANIKCGNSLLAPDVFEKMAGDKASALNPFSWEEEFPSVMSSGGFDVVVGNPPYVRIQRIPHDESDYIFEHYATPVGKTDLSTVFIEKALYLLNKKGVAGFICTSQWTATDYGLKIRRLLGAGRLHEVLDFGSLRVFQDAETYPAIYIFRHGTAPSVLLREIGQESDLRLEALNAAPSVQVPLTRFTERPWNLMPFDLNEHIQEIGADSTRLDSHCAFAIGDLTGMDEAFLLDSDTGRSMSCDIVRPYANRGGEVFAFAQTEPTSWVIYPYKLNTKGLLSLLQEEELRSEYPRVWKHLKQHEARLRLRQDSRRLYAAGQDWFRHLRPGAPALNEGERFIIKGIDKRSTVGTLSRGALFNGANVPAMPVASLSTIRRSVMLGLLNSSLVAYHLRGICPRKLGGYTRFTSTGLNSFPIVEGLLPEKLHEGEHASSLSNLGAELESLIKKMSVDISAHELVSIQRRLRSLHSSLDREVFDTYQIESRDRVVVEAAIGDRWVSD